MHRPPAGRGPAPASEWEEKNSVTRPRPDSPHHFGARTTRRAALGLLLGALVPAPARAQEWVDPGPGRRQAGEREVVVSLWQQRLWAYEGDVAVLAPWVSTGTAETAETATPVGQWRVLVKLW